MNISTTTKKTATALLVALQIAAAAGSASAKMIANPDPNDPGGGNPGTPPAYTFPADGYVWESPGRMSWWAYAWSELGEPNNWKPETYKDSYVNPTSWPITVQGCQSHNDFLHNVLSDERWEELQDENPAQYPDQTTLYKWDYNGKTTGFTTDCFGTLTFPAEGIYYAKLTVRKPGVPDKSWTHPIDIKDFLVVVLGDSSASGEGAPDYPVHDGVPRAEWEDNRCHRSMNAGGAQAARRIEDADKHSTVTFLSFACSGATLNSPIYNGGIPDPYENEHDHEFRGVGITAPYSGIEPPRFGTTGNPDFSNKVPSQVDQLWNALTNFGAHKPRKIDALIVAGGINDARFADLATICVLFGGCPAEDVGEINLPPRPGDVDQELDIQFQQDVARVPGGWDALGAGLSQLRLAGGISYRIEADVKLALQYPSFFQDDEGDPCHEVFDDALPWFLQPLYPFSGWDQSEIWWADTYWATDLDTAVRTGAERNHFTFVDTISNRFLKHGMCADNRFVNTPTDSGNNQGDDSGEAGALASLFSKGSAHPNVKGYAAYADEILRHLGHLMKRDGNNAPIPMSDKVTAANKLTTKFNVLANDLDADPVDVLAATILTQPNHGILTMQKDGSAAYKPELGFSGGDAFFYEVTDGTDTRIGLVSIKVMEPVRIQERVIAGTFGEMGVEVLLGGIALEPPYNLVLDNPLNPDFGDIELDDDTIFFDTPPLRRRRIRMPYTLFSATENLTSPSYGESVRGILTLKVRRK